MAKLFWKERKYEKFKNWLEKAVLLNKSISDSWCTLYLFYKSILNNAEGAAKTLVQVQEINPKERGLWKCVKKSETVFVNASEKKQINWATELVCEVLVVQMAEIK
jgi:hypothetical protein